MIQAYLLCTSEVNAGLTMTVSKSIVLTKTPDLINLIPASGGFKFLFRETYFIAYIENKLTLTHDQHEATIFKQIPISGVDALFRFEIMQMPGFLLRADQRNVIISAGKDLNSDLQTAFRLLDDKRNIMRAIVVRKSHKWLAEKDAEIAELMAKAEVATKTRQEYDLRAQEYQSQYEHLQEQYALREKEIVQLRKELLCVKQLHERVSQS